MPWPARLTGKKLLVALALEDKFASKGLQALDGDDDRLTAIARALVQTAGIHPPASREDRPIRRYPRIDVRGGANS